MTRTLLTALLLATTLTGLAGCSDSKPAASGNVTMHDMEVVDGTANDSMADLDNATTDGTPLSNAGGLPAGPAVQGTESPVAGNSAEAGTTKKETGKAGTSAAEPGGNASTAE
ncbi:MAG TPA: hypothetical protein VF463_20325 [Sphingobium sp.]